MKKLMLILGVSSFLLLGCTTYHAEVNGAKLDMTYLLENKRFKTFEYNIETGMIKIENFGSETSQVVKTAVDAALGVK